MAGLKSPTLAKKSEGAMVRAFALILANNGGGAVANMLSVVNRFVSPFNAACCACKYAALAVVNALRFQLNDPWSV